MMNQRLPHAAMDLVSRQLKGLKIERLLDLSAQPPGKPLRMLEIGCGSGGISQYFATHPLLKCKVDAVDVTDSRTAIEGYRFTLVKGTSLPFQNAEFDIVISNHVIEHVGSRAEQSAHLDEIRRVMKPAGQGYLAVPNRWQVVEPHYRLAFLSWWPRRLRSPYLKFFRGKPFYDCEPLSLPEVESLLRVSRFRFENVCISAIRLMFEIEKPNSFAASMIKHVPDVWFEALRGMIPTLIYVFRYRQ